MWAHWKPLQGADWPEDQISCCPLPRCRVVIVKRVYSRYPLSAYRLWGDRAPCSGPTRQPVARTSGHSKLCFSQFSPPPPPPPSPRAVTSVNLVHCLCFGYTILLHSPLPHFCQCFYPPELLFINASIRRVSFFLSVKTAAKILSGIPRKS